MKRIAWLDLAKGITIFFVVLVHVLEGIYKTGQYRQFNFFAEATMGILFTFVMPVFFALSGFVYKPVSGFKSLLASLKKKIISLGVPYIIFSVIYVMLQHLGTDVHHLNSWQDLAHIGVLPIGYLWYLYVLFFVFVLVGLLSILNISPILQLTIYLLLLVLSLSQTIHLPYILQGVCMWTSSFYIGYLLKKKPLMLHDRLLFIMSVALFALGCIVQANFGGSTWFVTDMMTPTDVLAKLSSIPLFLYLFSHIKFGSVGNYFTDCGRYSLIIYLVHAPAASVIRIALQKLGLESYVLLVFLTLISAWCISLLVVRLVQNIPWLSLVFNPYQYPHRKQK
ncbi:acyltransferase family protein [Leuconostoc citreum]